MNIPGNVHNQWPDRVLLPLLQQMNENLLSIKSLLNQSATYSDELAEGSVSGIAQNTPTTVLTYVNSTGNVVEIDKIMGTADVWGIFTLEIDGDEKFKFKTSEQNRSLDSIIPGGLRVGLGATVVVKFEHAETFTATADSRIYGREVS